MNSYHLREEEGNIIDICSVYITGSSNTVNRHNISAGWRSASPPTPTENTGLPRRGAGASVPCGNNTIALPVGSIRTPQTALACTTQ